MKVPSAVAIAVPALGQLMVLMRALRGETVGAIDLAAPSLVALVLVVACLALQARLLSRETIVFSRS